MSGLYGVSINGYLRAFHEKKKIIKEFARVYKDSNPSEKLLVVKIKKSSISKISFIDEYYLTECFGIYVPIKYEPIISINSDKIFHLEYLLEEAITLIEEAIATEGLEKQIKRKKLIEAYDLLVEKKKEIRRYIPSVKELERMYADYELYRLHVDEDW